MSALPPHVAAPADRPSSGRLHRSDRLAVLAALAGSPTMVVATARMAAVGQQSLTLRTVVRVLARPDAIVVGILCEDFEPARIVSFSVRRDAPLTSEDHVRVVVGPFLDGRSGYVFAVNPSGARYDGLINPDGESDNPDWDGIWEAATTRTAAGWSVELRIPVQTLSFKPGLREWHFNV